MFQPISCLSPTKNKSITSNSHTFQCIHKNNIKLYHRILFQQKQNEQTWKDVEEKDTVPIHQFVEEENEFV